MKALNAITVLGIEIPGWTLETALFWLFFAVVVITVFMIIVFAVLINRVGKDKTIVVNAQEEKVEKVEYGITVTAPEGMPLIQVALYNGGNQIGLAVNLVDGRATIHAVPGDYMVKLFGLPEGYVAESEALTADVRTATVTVTEKPVEEKSGAPVVLYGSVTEKDQAETIDYEITVVAPEELAGLQVALFNGQNQVSEAANVVNCKANIAAPAGDYIVKVFGLPDDDFDVEAGLLSAENQTATVTVSYCEDYEELVEVNDDDELEDELVEYVITLNKPEKLRSLQVALFNGNEQITDAVNVENCMAKIVAPANDYNIKVFCLPDDDFEVDADLLSAERRTGTVTITYSEFLEVNEELEEEDFETVEEETEPELLEYTVTVEAPENLPAIQIALFNGDTQIGAAVNVVDGTATIKAEAGDYALKVFGLTEGYEVTTETLSAIRTSATVIITEPVKEEIAIAEAPAASENAPLIIEEESFDGGLLRYDRSFKARFIQSDNDVKNWYTELKNELLSYKKVHDRLSWKRESYNFGRISAARLSFRGNTLCLYLPLNSATYEDSKYKVESVEDHASYEDTPCMYRIKNERRVKYAKELIATVMENIGAVKIERDSVDYYEPYEGLVQLINKGLIKRTIKDKSAEAFFIEKKDN